MSPIIGLTASYNTSEKRFFISNAYIEAVEDSGGTPFVLPYVSRENIPYILKTIDGLILTGGGDINPLLLGEEPCQGIGEVSTCRDVFELQLAKKVMAKNMPVLGICRGMQVLAAAGGGRLIQDIYSLNGDFLCHSQKAPRNEETHLIEIKKDSFLSLITKETEIPVNSFHHQAVKECGENFIISAVAKDGIIEAIESRNKLFIGVQWHPETLYKTNTIQKEIFLSFIKKADLKRGDFNES